MRDIDGLLKAMGDHAAMADYEKRKLILKKYKSDVIPLLIRLRSAKIIGRNEIPTAPASHCDLCAHELEQDGIYVDGMLDDGSSLWANMCISCFMAKGTGISWGMGQLYAHTGDYWQCIGGGDPEACNAEEV